METFGHRRERLIPLKTDGPVMGNGTMPYRTMSLEDFAKHIGMDAREVQRLADRGKIPGQKIGGQWRFYRAKVTEWLQVEMHTLDDKRLTEIDRSMGTDETGQFADADDVVTSLIGLESINLSLPANTRDSVLRELGKLASQTSLLWDPEGLHEALVNRESLGSTALPNGVAIPHPRQPMPYVSAEPMICLARTSRGIPFGTPNGGLTSIFFLICCHDDRHHLRVLARLMRILGRDTVSQMHQVQTPEEMLELLITAEADVMTRGRKPS